MWITHNYSFTKETSTPGHGATCPLTESKCHANVRDVHGSFKNKDLDLDLENMKEIREFWIGWSENKAEKLLESLLVTMKRGEISSFVITWDKKQDLESEKEVANRSKTVANDNGDNTCTLTINLLDFNEVSPLWKLNEREKYELALCHKNEGTKLFKEESNLESAFYHYSLCAKYLISIPKSEVESNEKQKLMCTSYLNLAACQLKYKNYEGVITNCCKALNIEGKNVKALYRRATAYKELKRHKDAR